MRKILFLLFALVLIGCGDTIPKNDIPDPIDDIVFKELIAKYNIHKTGLKLESAYVGVDKTQIIINGRIDNKLWIGVYNTETNEQLYDWTDNQKLETRINTKDENGMSRDYDIDKYDPKDFLLHNNQLYFTLWGNNSKIVKSEDKLLYVPLYIIGNNTLIKKHLSYGLPSSALSAGYEGNIYRKIKPWLNGTFVQYEPYRQGDPKLHVFFSSTGEKLYTFDNTQLIIEQSEPIDMEQAIVLHSERSVIPNYYFSRFNLKTVEPIWISDKKPFEDIPNTAKMDSFTITKEGKNWSYATSFTNVEGGKLERNFNLNIETGEIVEK